jgi:cell division septal protein FtsQ
MRALAVAMPERMRFRVTSRGAYERAARMTRNAAYRAAIAIALVTAVGLVWINLVVGIIGQRMTWPT